MNTTNTLPLGTRLEFLVPTEPPYPHEIGTVIATYDDKDGAGYELEVDFGDGTYRVPFGSWLIVGEAAPDPIGKALAAATTTAFLLVGTLGESFRMIGPFLNPDDAAQWADAQRFNTPWEIFVPESPG